MTLGYRSNPFSVQYCWRLPMPPRLDEVPRFPDESVEQRTGRSRALFPRFPRRGYVSVSREACRCPNAAEYDPTQHVSNIQRQSKRTPYAESCRFRTRIARTCLCRTVEAQSDQCPGQHSVHTSIYSSGSALINLNCSTPCRALTSHSVATLEGWLIE